MTARTIVVVWFLVLEFSMVQACSSNQEPAAHDGGAGGTGSTEQARFQCGDASCSVGQDYCRDLSSRGGNTGTSDPNTQHTFSCVPFGTCAAHDCSCVPLGLFLCNGCSQPDGGGTLATCNKD
jgi:hypothetical protein